MRNPICTDAVHAHRSCNVLERLVAHVLEGEIKLTRGILLHARGDTDAAGLGRCFEPCSDVDTVAKDVAVLDHNVAHIDTDPKLDSLVRRYRRVALGHAGLQLGCTAQRIYHTAELDEEAVTRCLDEPAVMSGDLRIEQLSLYRLEPLEGTALVHPDQARVTCHIGSEDGGEAAGRAHGASLAARRRPDRNSSRCSGMRQCMAFGTTTDVMARSRSTASCASSSRPICE